MEGNHVEFAVHSAPLKSGGVEVTVYGEVDHHTQAPLRTALDEAVDAGGTVVVDMRACSFIDSSGIGALAGAALRLSEAERQLHIRGVGERLQRTFEVAGLTEHDSMTIEARPARPPG